VNHEPFLYYGLLIVLLVAGFVVFRKNLFPVHLRTENRVPLQWLVAIAGAAVLLVLAYEFSIRHLPLWAAILVNFSFYALFVLVVKPKGRHFDPLAGPVDTRSWILAGIGLCLMNIGATYSIQGAMSHVMEISDEEMMAPFCGMLSPSLPLDYRITLVAYIAVFGPIIEELVFRGMIFRSLRWTMSFWPSALASALAFSLVHNDSFAALSHFVTGCVFAWAYERTRDLRVPCLAHVLNNSLWSALYLTTTAVTQ
jgi:membrane protease YdiL (CAAX protease family)